MGHRSDTAEAIIARVASGAHGVVSRRELLDAGVSRKQVRGRRAKGLLIAEHPGVYRVGHRAPSFLATYTAAMKACGDRAALSGFSAAFLLAILKGNPPRPEVTAPARREVRGIRTRVCRGLDERDIAIVSSIRVTTVPRTIVDLAARMTAPSLARLCHEAGVRYRVTPAHVMAVLERRPTAPGARKLRVVRPGGEPVTLSELERRFLELLRE